MEYPLMNLSCKYSNIGLRVQTNVDKAAYFVDEQNTMQSAGPLIRCPDTQPDRPGVLIGRIG